LIDFVQNLVPPLAGHPILTVIFALLLIWQAYILLTVLAILRSGRNVSGYGLGPGIIAGLILLVLVIA